MSLQIRCHRCKGTGVDPATSGSCSTCGGDGQIESEGFHQDTRYATLDTRTRVLEIEVTLADLTGKMDALDAKLDVLDTHLDTIETKIDAI